MQINMEEESVSLLHDGDSQAALQAADIQKEVRSSSLLQNQVIEASKVHQERSLDPDLEKLDSCLEENKPTPTLNSSKPNTKQDNQSQQAAVQQKSVAQHQSASTGDPDGVVAFHILMTGPIIVGLPITILLSNGVYCSNSWAVFLFGYTINWATYIVATYIVPEFVNGDGGQALFQFMQILLTALSFPMFMQSCARGDNCSQQCSAYNGTST
jgi:hypothetical protein